MISRIVLAAFCLALAGASLPTIAGEGHDHGEETATPVSGNGPARLPDGSVFLPKPAQRQIGVRTIVTEADDLPRAIELSGKVTMDPNAGGIVQPSVAGRIEGGPSGLPNVGQAVKKGDVLAWVVPTTDPIERSNQAAQLAEFNAARALAEKRLARLRELSETVPRKEIEAAESELASLRERAGAVNRGLSGREELVAPVSGVIAVGRAVAGKIVDAREVVFEIVDPARLRVEALAYEPAIAADIASASLAIGTDQVDLKFIGAGRTLQEQAIPLYFSAESNALSGLAVGQPVKVVAQTRSTVRGVAVPAAALMRNPANQTTVWVKTAAEAFTPRTVSFEPLNGTEVAVTAGLKAGERVATDGATLINQIR
jgi:hypothetical protein